MLAALDPDLDSVINVNSPDDYDRRPGAAGPGGDRPAVRHPGRRPPRPAPVRAATVAEAAAATGVALDGHVVAALNGEQITRDGEMPLAAGDTVFFLSADAGG